MRYSYAMMTFHPAHAAQTMMDVAEVLEGECPPAALIRRRDTSLCPLGGGEVTVEASTSNL